MESHGGSDELRRHSICGSVRAYLDACSSYDDPLLEEMHRAEKGYLELLKMKKNVNRQQSVEGLLAVLY